MRRIRALGLALVVLTSIAGSASPGRAMPPYLASENVEHLLHIPLNNDSPGARIVDGHLYVTTSRDLKIYDISDPAAPELEGELVLAQQPYFAEEDVDTNGKILLIDGPNGPSSTLNVIDVRDKAAPEVIGRLGNMDQHTFTCVLDCTFAYGSRGAVVDLRRPSQPREVGDWREGTYLEDESAHDVTEVAPGLLVTSSDPVMLLDARRDPKDPRVLALGRYGKDWRKTGYFWLAHGNHWPRTARDDFLLTSGESLGPRCDDGGAAFIVWDASRWRETRSFEPVEEYRVKSGLPTEGRAPVNHLCSHWFDPHPDFHNGGLVAMGWYDHGLRLLEIGKQGEVSEVGYFMRPGGAMSAAYWATDDIVYTIDYHYGLDVLKIAGN